MWEMAWASHVALQFFLYFTFSSPQSSIVQSLHLKSIHRDSIQSPLYPGPLTAEEKLQLLCNYSETHTLLHESLFLPERIRPHVKASPNFYFVELTIGTPPQGHQRETYHLIMDTGSDLLWLQCRPCKPCWNQTAVVFNPETHSSSYAPLPCTHPLCDLTRSGWECINNECHYTMVYGGGASKSKGVLATETFGFASDQAQMEFVSNLVFGCGNENTAFRVPAKAAGLLGLNARRASLASQAGGGLFSYCLPLFINENQPPSLLKLGDDARLHGPRVKTLPFVPVRGSSNYFLSLADVSIAGRRIGFEPGAFAMRNLRGGFVIDSGSAFTRFMNPGPFERIKDKFKEHFKPFELQEVEHPSFMACYKDPTRNFTAFPSLTLHFENGNDFVVEPNSVVIMVDDNFCVAIMRMSVTNIFGAYQQHNYRFSYDHGEKMLSYTPADCSRE